MFQILETVWINFVQYSCKYLFCKWVIIFNTGIKAHVYTQAKHAYLEKENNTISAISIYSDAKKGKCIQIFFNW